MSEKSSKIHKRTNTGIKVGKPALNEHQQRVAFTTLLESESRSTGIAARLVQKANTTDLLGFLQHRMEADIVEAIRAGFDIKHNLHMMYEKNLASSVLVGRFNSGIIKDVKELDDLLQDINRTDSEVKLAICADGKLNIEVCVPENDPESEPENKKENAESDDESSDSKSEGKAADKSSGTLAESSDKKDKPNKKG